MPAADDVEADWLVASQAHTVEALDAFIEKWEGRREHREYIRRANQLITQIMNDKSSRMNATEILEARINYASTPDEVCNAVMQLEQLDVITMDTLRESIRQDHNLLSSAACGRIIERGILNRRDLRQCGIDDDFIDNMLHSGYVQNFESPAPLTEIAGGCTEVYFWGIPSSGKTCALGSILSVARNGLSARSMLPDSDCQGFGYMSRLSSVFTPDTVCQLPGGTPVTSTYEMRFQLQDSHLKVHPIACIDMAGELFTCMFLKDAGEQLNNAQQMAMDTLDNILLSNRSVNRKIHFFVIEYGAEQRLYNDLPQVNFLDAAAMHLRRKGVFRDQTDAIYIIITKADKTRLEGQQLEEHLKKYVEQNYLGFYNNLTRICEENEINGGKVKIWPFTIGEVCFKDFCRFNPASAERIVALLMERSYGVKPGRLTKLKDHFRK